jgi:uncharacterized OB-fold protein
LSHTLAVTVCRVCGCPAFPPRLVCRHCGSLDWRDDPEPEGVLEHATVVRRKLAANLEDAPPRVGLVSTPRGLRIVVGLESDVEPGERVRLTTRGGGVWAERPESAADEGGETA